MNAEITEKANNPNLIMTLALLSYLLIILDISIVITGLPEIQSDLGLSQTSLAWVQNIYTLTFGSFLLLGARAGDLIGRKRIFMCGVFLFTAGSLLVAVAQTEWLILLGRTIQGLGAAIIAPTTLALLSIAFPTGEGRTKALSYYAATAGVGTSLGLVIGGIFAGWLSWRIGFLINLPLGLLLLFAAQRYLIEYPSKLGYLDMTGITLSTLGMATLVYTIIHTTEIGWLTGMTIGGLVFSLTMLGWFIFHEAKTSHPLLPLYLFKHSERAGAYLARLLFLGTMVGFFFYSTQFMQRVLNFTPVQAGLAFLPFTIPSFFASIAVPTFVHHFGNTKVLIAALVLTATGMAALTQLHADSHYLLGLAIPMIILGLGNGAALGPLTVAGITDVHHNDAGAASGAVNVAHQFGGTLGLSVLVVIFTASYSEVLTGSTLLAHQISHAFDGAFIMALLAIFIVIALILLPESARLSKRQAET